MPLKHRLLAAAYHPLRMKNRIMRRLSGNKGGRLRVLLYHDIAPINENQFAAQLRWLSRSWRFISPADFELIISSNFVLDEDSLLLTFDDGLISNRRIVETVLNPLGIKAIFFVVSEFVSILDEAECRSFLAQNIYPGLQLDELPRHWRNLTFDDLSYLVHSGHTIGAHTAHHARLSHIVANGLQKEIVTSANFLEERLSIEIKHFAYTFGDLASFSPAALAVARNRFSFIHTGLRGCNDNGVPPWAIRRDAIADTDSLALVGSLLEGGADCIYKSSLKTYESWGN